MKIDETLLELQAMCWFEATGWATAEGPDLSPGGAQDERNVHEHVVVSSRSLIPSRIHHPSNLKENLAQ